MWHDYGPAMSFGKDAAGKLFVTYRVPNTPPGGADANLAVRYPVLTAHRGDVRVNR